MVFPKNRLPGVKREKFNVRIYELMLHFLFEEMFFKSGLVVDIGTTVIIEEEPGSLGIFGEDLFAGELPDEGFGF